MNRWIDLTVLCNSDMTDEIPSHRESVWTLETTLSSVRVRMPSP